MCNLSILTLRSFRGSSLSLWDKVIGEHSPLVTFQVTIRVAFSVIMWFVLIATALGLSSE